MIVRAHQQRAFERTAVQLSERRMLVHVRKHFPLHHRTVPDENVRALLSLGRAKAREYGLTTEREAATMVSLMLHLGSGFDSDPLLPWAQCTLRLKDCRSTPAERLQVLFKRMVSYKRSVHGPGEANWIAALERLERALAGSKLSHRTGVLWRDDLAAWLRGIFPQKSALLTTRQLHELLERACGMASSINGANPGGAQVLSAGLAFVFGAGFSSDPVHGWAAQCLRQDIERASKVDWLQTSAVRALRKWIAAGKAPSVHSVAAAKTLVGAVV